MGRRLLALGAALVAAIWLWVPVPTVTATDLAPPGYQTSSTRTLVRGAVAYDTAGRGVHATVARLEASAAVRVTSGLGLDRVVAAEPTSSMCARTNCLLAVNGDYFDMQTKHPVGGVVRNGEIVRSPTGGHPQLSVTSQGWTMGPLEWSGRVEAIAPRPTPAPEPHVTEAITGGPPDPGKLNEPTPAPKRLPGPIGLAGVNVPAVHDAVVAYTPNWHPTTSTGQGWTEMTVGLAAPLRAEGAQGMEPRSLTRGGNALIPADGVVLSGHGDGARDLERMWDAVRSGRAESIRFTSDIAPDGVLTSLGGGPILARGGRPADVSNSGRHPRTLVGWDATGRTWLVAVDGRQPGYSQGMTFSEAATFMLELGATEVFNLDGGGSTTFVEKGRVANRPVQGGVRGKERAVANALLAIATEPLIEATPPPPPPEPPAPDVVEAQPASVGAPATPVPEPTPKDGPIVVQGAPDLSYGSARRPPVPTGKIAVAAMLLAVGFAAPPVWRRVRRVSPDEAAPRVRIVPEVGDDPAAASSDR